MIQMRLEERSWAQSARMACGLQRSVRESSHGSSLVVRDN